jgi:hypothetical protein
LRFDAASPTSPQHDALTHAPSHLDAQSSTAASHPRHSLCREKTLPSSNRASPRSDAASSRPLSIALQTAPQPAAAVCDKVPGRVGPCLQHGRAPEPALVLLRWPSARSHRQGGNFDHPGQACQDSVCLQIYVHSHCWLAPSALTPRARLASHSLQHPDALTGSVGERLSSPQMRDVDAQSQNRDEGVLLTCWLCNRGCTSSAQVLSRPAARTDWPKIANPERMLWREVGIWAPLCRNTPWRRYAQDTNWLPLREVRILVKQDHLDTVLAAGASTHSTLWLGKERLIT